MLMTLVSYYFHSEINNGKAFNRKEAHLTQISPLKRVKTKQENQTNRIKNKQSKDESHENRRKKDEIDKRK